VRELVERHLSALAVLAEVVRDAASDIGCTHVVSGRTGRSAGTICLLFRGHRAATVSRRDRSTASARAPRRALSRRGHGIVLSGESVIKDIRLFN